MYSTCIFCNASLGANQAVEHFPVGRRLAFDSARGRLWAVCGSCFRWNLSPLDERWEAIEECERLFESTPLRASSGEVGLARVGEGLELIRIGAPARDEFAAWRYADSFARRRRRNLALGGAAFLALVVGAPAIGLATGVSAAVAISAGSLGESVYKARKVQLRTRATIGGATQLLDLTHNHVVRARLLARGGDDFALEVPHFAGIEPRASDPAAGVFRPTRTAELTGADALRVAGQILTRINGTSGSRDSVRQAVALAVRTPDAARVFVEEMRSGRRRLFAKAGAFGVPYLGDLEAPARLALEMLTHEEQERRALDGELAELARAWRDAEEIAAISDDMFIPASVHDALARVRGSRRG